METSLVWRPGELRRLLERIDASQLQVATAYLSGEGLDLLEQVVSRLGISRSRVKVYVSSEFDSEAPAALLERLNSFALAAVLDDGRLHAKVILADGNAPLVLVGSANITGGGFGRNLEMGAAIRPSPNLLQEAQGFFDYCAQHSLIVDDEVIQAFASAMNNTTIVHVDEPSKLHLRSALKSIRVKREARAEAVSPGAEDPFLPTTYDLTNQIFKYGDYEVFFDRCARVESEEMDRRRDRVQGIMLPVAAQLAVLVKTIGLREHGFSTNRPWEGNDHHHHWLAARFGKQEIFDLPSFKHANLQVTISPTGVFLGLFHATQSPNSVDRDHLHEQLTSEEKQDRVVEKLRGLKGYGMQWVVEHRNTQPESTFDLDQEDASEFINWYLEHDRDGRNSFIGYSLAPDSPALRTAGALVSEGIRCFKLLMPLYREVAFFG